MTLKNNKNLTYENAVLKIKDIRKKHVAKDSQQFLRLDNKAKYNLFYNTVHLINQGDLKRGLPRFPDKFYLNNGWKGWFDYLSCHELNTHYFRGLDKVINFEINIEYSKTDPITHLPIIDFLNIKKQIQNLIKDFNNKQIRKGRLVEEINSKNTWKDFYKSYSDQESYLGSLLSLENFFKGKKEIIKNSKGELKEIDLWRGWPDLLGTKRETRILLGKNNKQREFHLKKKYSSYTDASKEVKTLIRRLEDTGLVKKKIVISTIHQWKKFYKDYSHELGNIFQTSIPYRPDLEETYKDEWVSYLHFTGKSFFDLHQNLINEFSIYNYKDYLENKNSGKLKDVLQKIHGFNYDIFIRGLVAVEDYFKDFKNLSSESTKLINWRCKICKTNFSKSIYDLVKQGNHNQCKKIENRNYFDCEKCKDEGIIMNDDLESFSHCDCDYALTLEDHPDYISPELPPN